MVSQKTVIASLPKKSDTLCTDKQEMCYYTYDWFRVTKPGSF